MAINPANVVSDFDSGKMYDVSDPAHPIEVTAKRNSDGSYTYNPVGGSTPSSGSIITKNTNTQTSGNGHYVTDTETGKTYFVPDDNPAKPVNVAPKPAYDIDDTGKVTYNKDNTAGIPDIRQPTTVIKPTSDQVAAALGGVPITDSGTRATSLDIKLDNLNNELSALNKSFDNTWEPLIDQNNVFTGTDNQYLQYQKDLQLLESKQSEINKELDKNYIKLADGNYMPKDDYNSLSKEYQLIARKQGFEALNKRIKSDYKQLPDGSLILKTDYWNLDKKYRDIADKQGYNAMSSQMDKDQKLQDEAFKKLELYKDADGNYNISQYLLDAKSPAEGLTTLRNAGFSQDDIVSVAKGNLQQAELNREAVKEAYSLSNLAKSAVLDTLPVVGTIRYAKDASTDGWTNGEKALVALSVVGDIAIVIPFVGALSAGARAGGWARGASTIAKAEAKIGVGSRLAGASRGAYEFALSEIKSPFTTILHPIDTAKAMASPLKLLKRSHVPLASLEVSDTIIKVPAKYLGNTQEAIKAGDRFTQAAVQGKNVYVPSGNMDVKVRPTVASKLGEPVIIHTTDNINPFVDQAKANKGINKVVGEDRSIESALFGSSSAPEDITYRTNIPLPPGKFTEQYRKLTKFTAQDIAKIDIEPVRNLDLSVSNNIPKNAAKGIEDIIRKNDGILGGSFSEYVKVPTTKIKPNDIDVIFETQAQKTKFLDEIETYLKSLGYETERNQKLISIKVNGKWVETANAWTIDAFKSKTKGLFEVQAGNKVNGIRTLPLGSQMLAQGLGSNAKDAKALIRKLKFNKDAELVLAGTKGHTKLLFKFHGGAIYKKASTPTVKKNPGGLIFRGQDEIDKFQSSNKLWAGTREDELALAVDKEFQVKQWITTTRTDGTTLKFGVVGKPFTNAELAKMKVFGTTETVKQIWSPAVSLRDAKTGKKIQVLQNQLNNAQNNLTQLRNFNAPRAKINAASRSVSRLSTRISRLQSTLSNTRTSNAVIITDDRSPIRELNRLSSRARVNARGTSRVSKVRYDRLVEDASREIVRPTRVDRRGTKPNRTGNRNVEIITPKRTNIIQPPDRRDYRPIRINPPDRIRPPTRVRPPDGMIPKTRRPTTNEKEKKRRELFASSITWRQGFGWWAIKAPYKSKSDVAFFYKTPPPNAREVKGGAGSALRSIQVLTGKAPNKLAIDLGIMDIVIDKGKVITFKRDIKQKRKGDIELKTSVSQVRQVRKKRKVGKNKDFWE